MEFNFEFQCKLGRQFFAADALSRTPSRGQLCSLASSQAHFVYPPLIEPDAPQDVERQCIHDKATESLDFQINYTTNYGLLVHKRGGSGSGVSSSSLILEILG